MGTTPSPGKASLMFDSGLACVAWCLWLSALNNKGGQGKKKPQGDWGGSTLFFSRLRRSVVLRQNRYAGSLSGYG